MKINKDEIFLALDLDGTLIKDNKEFTEKTKYYLEKVINEGVEVCIVTGRYFQSVKDFAINNNLKIPIISANGALIKDPFTLEILYEATIPLKSVEKIISYSNDLKLLLHIFSDESWYVNKINETVEKYAEENNVTPKLIKNIKNNIKKNVIKMVIVDKEEKINKLVELINKNKVEVNTFKSDPYSIDLISPIASKGEGIKRLIENKGKKYKKIIAAGNYFNDVDMFEVANYSVAMENSPNKVKERADRIVGSNNDEGIIELLKELV